ncbi:MAG: hypothetical protein H0X25_01750, partial [Acidobacteriales bacterium]|nr:hypothetical protein [Terriglobales bacterium]
MKTAQHRATPVQLRLGVQEGSGETQQELTIPTCRGYAHLVAMVADAENHVTCDLQSGMAFGWVTEAAAAQRGHLRYHFLEAAALILLVAKYLTPIHAACVSLGDSGVLLCGDSGAGKSSLSFACAQRGWTYVTDDGSYLVRDSHDRTVVANPNLIRFRSSAKSLFPELGDQDITRRLNGEFGIELRTQEIPGLRISSQPRIDHVVMLRRRSGAAPSITKMDPAELRAWLEQVVCYGDEQVCAEQRDSFERLLTAN